MANQWIDRRSITRIARTLLTFAGALVVPLSAAASITGVCPDGSIFIVQRAGSIPCRDAKTVDPTDLPPLRPELLPRPYGWEVFNRRNDPNNPYNLIQSKPIDDRVAVRSRRQRSPEREVREQRVPSRSDFIDHAAPARTREPDSSQAALSPAEPQIARLGLVDREIEDLVMIVDLSQRRAPAALMSRGSGGRVQLATSHAFESRLRRQFASNGSSTTGNVVLFSADTQVAGSFYGNLTFVQGYIAYQPDSNDPFQLGLIHGSLGELGVDEPVLGYVILPERIDLAAPIDIYWNDIQITATLRP